MVKGFRVWRLVMVVAAGCVFLPEAARPRSTRAGTATDARALDKRPEGCTGARTFPVPGSRQIRSTRRAASAVSGWLERLIDTHATAYQVRADLVRAVIQTESAFNRARDRSRARWA